MHSLSTIISRNVRAERLERAKRGALCPELEIRVLDLADAKALPWRLPKGAERAPETLAGLRRCWAALQTLIIDPANSDPSVYSSPSVNYAWRALHDTLHLRLGAGMDPFGESLTAFAFFKLLGPGLPDVAYLLAWIETEGQSAHHEATGAFPENQREFALGALATMGDNMRRDILALVKEAAGAV